MSVQKERNEVLRLLNPMKKHHYYGSNGFSCGNGYKHELIKADLAYVHASKGHSVILEATFKGGGRCDLICLDCRKIFEIAVSESEESIQAKLKRYPEGLEIEVVRVDA